MGENSKKYTKKSKKYQKIVKNSEILTKFDTNKR